MIIDRRTPRVATDEHIEYDNTREFVRARMRNLSIGGVFISTDLPLPIDAQFAIRLRIPGSDDVFDVQGRVVWNKKGSLTPAGMGVQFVDLPAACASKIQAYINSSRADTPGQGQA